MTVKQFTETVKEHQYRQQLEQVRINITNPALKLSKTLVGAVEIFNFVDDQVKGFSRMKDLGPTVSASKSAFESALSSIVSMVTNNNVDQYHWENLLRPISRDIYIYNHPTTDFINLLEKESPEYVQAAIHYFSSGSLNSISDKNNFAGYILAAEFDNKGSSNILKKSRLELQTIERAREQVLEKSTEANNSLITYFDRADTLVQEFKLAVDSDIESKSLELDTWIIDSKKKFDDFTTDTEKQRKLLEETYQNKLRLEPAAQYWKQRATVLRKDGQNWIGWLIADIVVSVGILITVLILISNGTIAEVFKDVGTAVKWSIVFITLVSFMAYGLRILSRLAFSSFHLARDAEEREQLAYVFLSLSKDTSLDETQRNLITQSLFSRSDSGLLREESSPTMPGNIIDKVTQKVNA